jgi:hypothetical protein
MPLKKRYLLSSLSNAIIISKIPPIAKKITKCSELAQKPCTDGDKVITKKLAPEKIPTDSSYKCFPSKNIRNEVAIFVKSKAKWIEL